MRKRYKVLLLLLIPVIVIIGGAIFNIPHSGKVGFFIILFYILLGNLYGEDRMEGRS
ncbi:MAG TPA: hypothetical protein VNT20_23825 [Flavisolibacter sp.]|jgi:hypothetical protein|nr:hypothetical protein [Flavisolibacter sp.]